MEPQNTPPDSPNSGLVPDENDTSATSSPLTPAAAPVADNSPNEIDPAGQPLQDSGHVLGVPAAILQPPPQSPVSGQPLPNPAIGKKFPKRKLLIGALAAVLLAGLSLGYVFAFYLPNKPANVYQTGLDRSGKNLTKLVDKFTAADKLKQLENSEITATAEAKGEGYSFNGTFGVKLAKTKSDGSLDLKIKSGDEAEKALNVKFLSDVPTDKQYPNFYFQINGLKSLGLDFLSPEIAAYEGKWIAVESDYLESISSGQSAPKNKENVTSAEVASLVRTISNTSNEYLLTADKNKAVLENKAFVGKEKTDGIDTYHYRVGINKNHAKDYCKALSGRVISDPVYKKLLNLDDAGTADQKKSAEKGCDDLVSSIKDDTALDMWIDGKYKLIHKLRIYDKNDKSTHTDIGQTYTGGDKISFFVAYHKEADKTDAKFTIDVDTKAFTSKGTFTWVQAQPQNNTNIKITFEAKPYAGDVKAEKPAGAISIQEVLSKFGIEPPAANNPSSSSSPSSSPPPGSIQTKAKDTERQTDINALHGQVEAFYAQNGYYPNFDNLNSAAWRAANMKGLDNEALKDPDGTSYAFATTASAKQYGYLATGCTQAECQAYTLTAVLSDGSKYTKQNLN